MQNISSTFLAQFANSPIMLALLNTMNLWVDPSANLANFYANVWNVATAEGYGLDRIGRVVGVSRRISTPDYIANQFFAFKENTLQATLFGPAGQYPFWDGSTASDVVVLTDAAFRTLIYVKASSNISGCSAQALNYMITTLFGGSGQCYWVDQGKMAAQLVFTFAPSVIDFYILTASGALPCPAGVTLTYSIP